MKKIIAIILLALVVLPGGLALWLYADTGESADAPTLKRKAYDLSERGQFEESAAAFHAYLAVQPADAQSTYDYAVLLVRLNRNAEAADMLDVVHRLDPKREAAYFKLGEQCVLLKREEQAARIFAELAQSTNPDIASSAAEAAARLKADQERAAQFAAEKAIYDLAKEFKYDEVITAINEMEKKGELSYAMAMQRIYAQSNLRKYAPALELADALAVKNPKAVDLMIVRAELMLQLGRKADAVALWEKVAQENPGSDYAKSASQRLAEVQAQDAAAAPGSGSSSAQPVSDTDVIYSLAEKRKYQEVVAAIDELEKKNGTLPWPMQMQRLYSLQAMGGIARANALAAQMAAARPDSVELAVMRSDMLAQEQRWLEASKILKDIKDKNPNTPVAKEADRRLREFPGVANVDKLLWGETYMSGDYHSRFDSLIGYGYLRAGTYFDHARWLQPYLGLTFVADTKSGAGARQTIIADNSVGLHAGLRAQLFTTEYLFLYVQGGMNNDLLGRRKNGNWGGDYQAGIYGYKGWGPGIAWKQYEDTTNTVTGEVTSNANKARGRGDWWVDAGADFSYYDRFSKWLGYAQVREGLRLAQLGNNAAVDAYVMQNFAWDVAGNFTDNLAEIGPGVRLVVVPYRNCQVVLRAEWAEGLYFGRDDTNQRGSTASTYGDFRVGLSVGANW